MYSKYVHLKNDAKVIPNLVHVDNEPGNFNGDKALDKQENNNIVTLARNSKYNRIYVNKTNGLQPLCPSRTHDCLPIRLVIHPDKSECMSSHGYFSVRTGYSTTG